MTDEYDVRAGLTPEQIAQMEADNDRYLRAVRLLVDKGVITWPEWWARLADDMEREVAMYEQQFGVRFE